MGSFMRHKIILVCVTIFLISCARTINEITYYVLDFPIPVKGDTKETVTNDVCEILPVQIADVYARQRIALRKRSNEIIYYHYHQWGENPDENVSRLIQKKLSSDALFSRISDRIWNVSPRYQLLTRINNLEVIEGEDSLFAHINMDLELFDKKTDKIAVTHEFNDIKGLEDWDMNEIVMLMSSMLKDEINLFSYKIRVYLVSQKQKQNL